jgi:hypothetical protein
MRRTTVWARLQFAAKSLNLDGGPKPRVREHAMGKSTLAVIAVAVIGAALLIADSASARGGAGSGAARGGASRGGAVASPRSGIGGRGVIRRHGSALVRHGAVRVRHPGWARPRRGAPLWAEPIGVLRAPVLEAASPSGEQMPGVSSNCQVQRVQISDDDGWRVRDAVVCP